MTRQILRITLALLCFVPVANAADYSRTQLVFGNVELTIQVTTSLDQNKAFAEIEKGFALANRFNEVFSTYKPDSEISRLNNRSKPAAHVSVSQDLYNVLKTAIEVTRATDGFFDLTFEMPKSGIDQVQLQKNSSIDLKSPDVRLNPTGLVKGYTVDRIIALLQKNKKISAAFVAAGGDMRQFNNTGHGTTVALYDPLPAVAGTQRTVILKNSAVSTSGFYERGRHIKNTKKSPVEHLQTSVTAPDCTTSDALDNTLFFMPIEKIRATLKKFPKTHAIVYEKNGRILEL